MKPAGGPPVNRRRSPPLRWLWVVLGLAAMAVALAPAAALSAALGAAPTAAAPRHFRIEASSFAYAPAELIVNPGDRVTLELAASDYVHGLHLDGYGVEAVAEPGRSASVSFVADRPGTFRFRCSVTCGALHPFMIGKLHVGPNLLLWRAGALAALAAAGGLLWGLRRP